VKDGAAIYFEETSLFMFLIIFVSRDICPVFLRAGPLSTGERG
jgi:hypothetical protein